MQIFFFLFISLFHLRLYFMIGRKRPFRSREKKNQVDLYRKRKTFASQQILFKQFVIAVVRNKCRFSIEIARKYTERFSFIAATKLQYFIFFFMNENDCGACANGKFAKPKLNLLIIWKYFKLICCPIVPSTGQVIVSRKFYCQSVYFSHTFATEPK